MPAIFFYYIMSPSTKYTYTRRALLPYAEFGTRGITLPFYRKRLMNVALFQ